jgi:CheY-like chemotaxis protein
MEQQMRAAQRMEAVGRLAGGVAHDFNNILTVILSCSELLRSEFEEGDPALEDVDAIHSAAERATKLTNQLLTFSRRQDQTVSVLNLSETVCEIDAMLHRLIGEDVDLVTTLEKHPGLVEADSSQIGQVLMNLAVNARDAMPNGGTLTIETANVTLGVTNGGRRTAKAPPGDYVMLAVSDTGTGMDEETCIHAFDPFFSTKGDDGTGLGLSTVYGIVKQNNGYIQIDSELEHGTTFEVYLPRVEADEPTHHPEPEPVGRLGGSETVLIVEDEQLLRRAARRILSGHGYNVVEATHGDDALIVCERHEGEIHVMLTDLIMPGMGGRELASRVAVLRPAMKVVYMSGYTEDAIASRGDLPEDISFIQKPFSPDALLQKLRHVFDAAQ